MVLDMWPLFLYSVIVLFCNCCSCWISNYSKQRVLEVSSYLTWLRFFHAPCTGSEISWLLNPPLPVQLWRVIQRRGHTALVAVADNSRSVTGPCRMWSLRLNYDERCQHRWFRFRYVYSQQVDSDNSFKETQCIRVPTYSRNGFCKKSIPKNSFSLSF